MPLNLTTALNRVPGERRVRGRGEEEEQGDGEEGGGEGGCAHFHFFARGC